MHNTKKYQWGGVLKSLFRHLAQSLAAQRIDGWWLQCLTWRFRVAEEHAWPLESSQETAQPRALFQWVLSLRSYFCPKAGLLLIRFMTALSFEGFQLKVGRGKTCLKLWVQGLSSQSREVLVTGQTKVASSLNMWPSADPWRGGALCG